MCKIIICRVDSEYQVFCATMNWVNHDISNRRRSVRMEIKYLGVRGGKLVYDDISLVKYEVNLYISPGLFFISRFIFDVLKHVRLPLVATKLLESYVNNCTDISLKVFFIKINFLDQNSLDFRRWPCPV